MSKPVDLAVQSVLRAIASIGKGEIELTDSFVQEHGVTAIADAFAGEYVDVGRIFEDNSNIDWMIFKEVSNGHTHLNVNALANRLYEFLKPTPQREFLLHNRVFLKLTGLGKMVLDAPVPMAIECGPDNETDARKAGNKPTTAGLPKSKRRRGRPVKKKPTNVDVVVKSMIDSGDVARYGRKWSELVVRYRDKLPKSMSADALRKRIEAEERRSEAENK